MGVFTIIISVLLITGLAKNYRLDAGEHKKAKIIHAICLTLLCLSYSGSFRHVGWLMFHFDKTREIYSADIGAVPGNIHFLIYLVHLVLALFILMLSYQMINRNTKARVQLLYFLPFLALTEAFNFYRGWFSDGDDGQINHFLVFWVGLVLFGGLSALIIIVYTGKSMKSFFAMQRAPSIDLTAEHQDIQGNTDNKTGEGT
jgi:hypothetical protein